YVSHDLYKLECITSLLPVEMYQDDPRIKGKKDLMFSKFPVRFITGLGRFAQKKDEDTLNLEIVEGLIHVLDKHNGLVRLYRTARDRCSAGEIPGFKIRLYNKGGIRGYELPTSDILGGIVSEDGPNSRTDFDVIIEFRDDHPQRTNKLHQSYLSLQFPLLFIFGEP
nr:helitron helicase-like domain-containing protein [Tanacetum cinerariifolium]